MTIIDRYLLKQFWQTFLICFLSLAGLYIVIDAFTNLDEFLRYAKRGSDLLAILSEFYGYRSIFFFDRTSGVLALVTAMFTLTWFQQHQELTALLAAGVPPRRVVVPVLLASAAISAIAAVDRELVIPGIRSQLSRNPKDLAGEIAQEMKPRYDNETDVLFRGHHTLAKTNEIGEPNFLLPPELSRFGRQLVARSAYYRTPSEDHPGGYLFDGVSQPAGIADQPSVYLGDRAVILTPGDHPWLGPDQCFLVSNVTFEQLAGGNQWQQLASTEELIRGLRNPSLDFGADVRVAIHARFVQPFLDVTLLFLGVPLILQREQRNIFLAIGLAMLIVGVFMFVVLASQYLGSIYLLPPAFAAWLPLIVFVPVAAWMSDSLWA